MNCKLFRFVALLLLGMMAPAISAADSKVTMTTQAPAGTELRIYSLPYNSTTVTGADAGEFFGTYISKGPGTQITIAGDIDQLEIYKCQLSDLRVESAPDMYILKCYDNQLEAIDLSNCTGLSVLDCHANKLSSIDVSGCNQLEELNASSNMLTEVKLGSQPVMRVLDLSHNKLAGFDMSGLPVLEDLYVQNNLLVSLDTSASKKLYWVYAFCNQLAGDGMDEFMSKLPEGAQSPSMLYIVDTFAEAGVEGNVCLVKNVAQARAKGWATLDYANGVNNGSMTGQFYYGADYVPTVSENGVKLTTSRNVGETIKLYVKASGDFAIDGVAETSFISGSNTLTLTSQEVTVKGDLRNFECIDDGITSLTFLGTPSALTSFDCSKNAIESLEIVNATALTQIHAQENALKSLNIEGCTGLMRVDCYSNQLSGKAMRLFMESLPDGTANEPFLFVIDTKNANEGNVATTTDVAIATGKHWEVFDYIGGDRYGMGQSYAGSEPTGPEIPDEYFTFTTLVTEVMLNLEFADATYEPIVEGAELLGWNGTALTLRTVPGQTVTVYGDLLTLAANFAYIDTFDASACPNLVDLNLMLNELKALDLTKNTKLTTLQVIGNALESLKIEGCTELGFINAYGNCLKGDAMTELMSTLPVRATSNPGQIIIYDPHYDREHNECYVKDVNAALERNWIVYSLDANMDIELFYGLDFSGVESVASEAAPVEYFNLQGVRVENPAGGIFIRRQGNATSKVYLK